MTRKSSLLVPVLIRHWDVEHITGLTDEAEAARTRMLKRMSRIARAGRRFDTRRAESAAQALATSA